MCEQLKNTIRNSLDNQEEIDFLLDLFDGVEIVEWETMENDGHIYDVETLWVIARFNKVVDGKFRGEDNSRNHLSYWFFDEVPKMFCFDIFLDGSNLVDVFNEESRGFIGTFEF